MLIYSCPGAWLLSGAVPTVALDRLEAGLEGLPEDLLSGEVVLPGEQVDPFEEILLTDDREPLGHANAFD